MSHRFVACTGGLAVAALLLGFVENIIGARVQAQSVPSHEVYQVVENYFKMPKGRPFGSTAAVDIDRDGRSIWIFERCGGASQAAACGESTLAPILKFDPSGRLVKSFGAGMFANPHGIHVDRQGNIWVTDGAPVKNGKGLVVYHHASSAFDTDKEFEKVIAGGWRKQGNHGKMHKFTVTVRKAHQFRFHCLILHCPFGQEPRQKVAVAVVWNKFCRK